MNLGTDLLLFLLTILINLWLYVLLQVIVLNLLQVRRLIAALVATAIGSCAATGIIASFGFVDLYSSSNAMVLGTIGALTTFLGLSGVYALVGPVSADRSISAHILIHLARAPNGQLDQDELLGRYGVATVVQKRLKEMSEARAIVRDEGRLRVTGRGRRLAGVFLFLIRVLRLRENS